MKVQIYSEIKARGGSMVKKQVWLKSKSNQSWSYHFLRNRKFFVYDKNIARQSSAVLQNIIQGDKMTNTAIFDQYFQKYQYLSVQTCLKVRFYQVLHDVSFMSRNIEILKIWAKNDQKVPFSQKRVFLKITFRSSPSKIKLGT